MKGWKRELAVSFRPGPSRWVTSAAVLVVLGAACVGVTRVLVSFRRGASPLWVEARELNFGEVWAQSNFVRSISLRNRSTEEVSVLEAIPSCSCQAAVEPRSFVVPAGEARKVQLTLDLIDREPELSATSSRHVRVPIILRLREMSVAHFVLRGTVRDAFRVTPAAVDYGQSLREGAPFPTRELTVEPLVSMRVLEAEVNPAVGTVRSRRLGGSDRQFAVSFLPAPDLPPGPFSASLELHGVTADGERLPPYPVPIRGEVLADIQAVPERLDLGIHKLGDVANGTIVVQSYSGRSFEVTGVCPDPGPGGPLSISLDPPRGRLGSMHILHVRLAVRQRGHNNGLLRVAVLPVNNPKRSMMEIHIDAYAPEGNGKPFSGR